MMIHRTIDELILKLTNINEHQLKNARYSLDTVRELNNIADELKVHAREVALCCY